MWGFHTYTKSLCVSLSGITHLLFGSDSHSRLRGWGAHVAPRRSPALGIVRFARVCKCAVRLAQPRGFHLASHRSQYMEPCFKYPSAARFFSSTNCFFLYFLPRPWFCCGVFASSNWVMGLFIYSGYKALLGYGLQISSLGLWLLFFTLFTVPFDAHKCLHFNGVKSIHLFPCLFLFFVNCLRNPFVPWGHKDILLYFLPKLLSFCLPYFSILILKLVFVQSES